MAVKQTKKMTDDIKRMSTPKVKPTSDLIKNPKPTKGTVKKGTKKGK